MHMASVANKFYSLVLEHRGVNSKTQRFKASHSPSFIFFGIVIIYCHYSYFILSQARDERTIFLILSWLSTSKGMTSLVT